MAGIPASQWDELVAWMDEEMLGHNDLEIAIFRGAHGCGKTVELVPRLWKKIMEYAEEDAGMGTTLIYAQNTPLDNLFFQEASRKRILDWGDRAPAKFVDNLPGAVVETGEFGLTTLSRLNGMLSTGQLRDNTILVVDQPVTWSVDWHILHGQLRAARDARIAAGGSFIVQMIILTADARGSHLDLVYHSLLKADISVGKPNTALEAAPTSLELAAESVYGCITSGRNVVSFLGQPATAAILSRAVHGQTPATIWGKMSWAELEEAVAGPKVINVGAGGLDFGSKLPIPNVGLVLSSLRHPHTDMLVDEASSVSYKGQRRLTLSGARLQQSYVVDGVELCCDYGPNSVTPGVHQSVLQEDIFQYVLYLHHCWAGQTLEQMPTDMGYGSPRAMILEFVRRARVLDLVKSNRLTSAGQAVMDLLRGSSYSLLAACLPFAGPPPPTMSERSRRLLVRMAALHSKRSALQPIVASALQSRDTLAKACSGFARGLTGQGYLWILLGIWNTFLHGDSCLEHAVPAHLRNSIAQRIRDLESRLQLPQLGPGSDRLLTADPLSDHERMAVQLGFAHAGLFQTVWSPANASPEEMVAQRRVQLHPSAALLDDQDKDTVMIATLHRVPRSDAFEASDLTLVPKGALKQVANRFRTTVPNLILTTAKAA